MDHEHMIAWAFGHWIFCRYSMYRWHPSLPSVIIKKSNYRYFDVLLIVLQSFIEYFKWVCKHPQWRNYINNIKHNRSIILTPYRIQIRAFKHQISTKVLNNLFFSFFNTDIMGSELLRSCENYDIVWPLMWISSLLRLLLYINIIYGPNNEVR